MRVNYQEQLEAGIRLLTIHSLHAFSWAGMRYGRLPSQIPKSIPQETLRELLIFDLESLLYSNFYCVGFPAFLSGDISRASNRRQEARLTQQLSAANKGNGFTESDWTIREIRNGTLLASRHDLTVRLEQQDVEPVGYSALEPGQLIPVRWPTAFPAASPGFYLVLGNRKLADDDGQPIVRLYFNTTAQSAVHLMLLITEALNSKDIPFRFKVSTKLEHFSRSDAAVLYIHKGDYFMVHAILALRMSEISPALREGIPALTKRLMKGVALAESPMSQESFGQHRCRLVAEGLSSVFERRKTHLRDRLEAVTEQLISAGIDPSRPYLNANSADIYELVVGESRSVRQVRQSYIDPLAVANSIGEAIVEQSIWHRDRCSWVGASPLNEQHGNEPRGHRYAALGADLYSGTSGVALFLAELYAKTGEKHFARTAVGALEHALHLVQSSPPQLGMGLYTGIMGIAFTATRVSTNVGRCDFERVMKKLLTSARSRTQANRGFDLLSGIAGHIVGCLLLAKIWREAQLLDEAADHGWALLEASRHEGRRRSWGPEDRIHWTGMSHGAAGVAYALLGLYKATHDGRWFEAADEAFEYERQWFDGDLRNWRDFRWLRGRSKQAAFATTCMSHWCHGAPGIALSRLRALELGLAGSVSEEIHADVVAALDTTRKMVEASIHSGASNFSLCHGLAGNAEVLVEGSRVLGTEFDTGKEVAHEVALLGWKTYGDDAARWPCGSGPGTTPNLMCGLAGIGHFYLRIHDPSIPSVLMPRDEAL